MFAAARRMSELLAVRREESEDMARGEESEGYDERGDRKTFVNCDKKNEQ